MGSLELTTKEIFYKKHNMADFHLLLSEDEIKTAKEQLAKVGINQVRLENLSGCTNSSGQKMFRYVSVARKGRPRIEKGLLIA